MCIAEYPPEIQKPSAWYGPELDAQRDWIEALSDAEIAEIERAMHELHTRPASAHPQGAAGPTGDNGKPRQ